MRVIPRRFAEACRASLRRALSARILRNSLSIGNGLSPRARSTPPQPLMAKCTDLRGVQESDFVRVRTQLRRLDISSGVWHNQPMERYPIEQSESPKRCSLPGELYFGLFFFIQNHLKPRCLQELLKGWGQSSD